MALDKKGRDNGKPKHPEPPEADTTAAVPRASVWLLERIAGGINGLFIYREAKTAAQFKAESYFDDAVDLLRQGDVIILVGRRHVEIVTVRSPTGKRPISFAAPTTLEADEAGESDDQPSPRDERGDY